QKLNEQEKKLLIAYLDTIDYSCGTSFYNAENLFGLQNQTFTQSINDNQSKLEENFEIESESELIVTRSKLSKSKGKKRISSEIESSNSEH
ncbi:15000_t:CDS:1, partial [Racocetra persica]